MLSRSVSSDIADPTGEPGFGCAFRNNHGGARFGGCFPGRDWLRGRLGLYKAGD